MANGSRLARDGQGCAGTGQSAAPGVPFVSSVPEHQ